MTSRMLSVTRSGRSADSLRRLSGLPFPWWSWVLAIVFVEAALLLIFVPTSWSWATLGDGAEYQRYASNLLHHGVFSEAPVAPYFPGVVRSPGYPAFLASLEWLGGAHVVPVEIAQFAIVAAMAILVGLIGREVAGPTVGTVAAVLCATYLPFLSYATRFLTEDLASFGLTFVVWLLLRTRRSESLRLYAVIGLALALLAYVRPESALLAVPITVILVVRRRSSWMSAARWSAALAFAIAFVIPLAPWMVRNASVTGGRLLPMAANSGSDLLASADQYHGLISNDPDFKIYDAQVARIIGSPRTAAHGIQASVEFVDARRQVQVDNEERSAAIKLFDSLSLGMVVRRTPKRLLYLWGTAYPAPPGRFSHLAHDLAILQWLLLSILGAIGLAGRRRQLLGEWPLWIGAAYLTVVHMVFHVETRYTLPARPTLMIYSTVGALGAISVLRRVVLRRPGSTRASVDSA